MTFKLQSHEIHSAVQLHRLAKYKNVLKCNCLCHVDRNAGKQMNLSLNLVQNINYINFAQFASQSDCYSFGNNVKRLPKQKEAEL